jgi:hypothetical protein
MTSESVGWYINSSDSFSGATLLQTGPSITLTQSFLESYKSRYLICAVTGVNQGGTQIMFDSHYLYYFPPVAPTPTPVAPTPLPARDTSAPVGSSWNNAYLAYPGGPYTVSFKVTDNVGVSRVQFVLVKSGVDILTQAGTSMSGLTDFYSGVITIPSNATGVYGIRFEAFDAAGNKYSWFSNGSPTIVSAPVYTSGRSFSTTSLPTGRVKAGDTFTCEIGSWANLTANFEPTCLWTIQDTGVQVEGRVFTVTQALAESSNKLLGLAIRVKNITNNTVAPGYIQVPGGLEFYNTSIFKSWSLDGPR